MKTWPQILLTDLAAILLGTAMTFAFAPYEIFPLAILALAGLLILWLNATLKGAFRLGFLFGLGMFGCGVYWIFISVHRFGGVPTSLALLITSGFIAGLALFPALVGYLLNRYFPNSPTKIIYAFPAIWVFSEWIRSWIFTGFPWLFLGYSQTNSPLKGYAPIFSVYGVSLAVSLTSALIVNSANNFKFRNYQSAYLNLFFVVTLWTVGGLLNLIPWTKPNGNPIPVSLVQGNIPQQIKWSANYLKLSFDRYEELTEKQWGKNKLIIWPEAAIPLALQDSKDFINLMDEKARSNNAHLLLGIPIQAPSGEYFNAIVTLGNTKKVYIKRRLVPFGEYTPFSPLFSKLFYFLDIPMSDVIPGKKNQDPFVIDNVKISSFICYEIAFPELVRSIDKSIGVLLTVTNDAWFGESAAQAQHLQMAEMRAMEMGRPVLFVSNNGVTAIIGPDGKIESAAPPLQTFVLNGNVQPTYGLTPWMRNGMDPILFILLSFLFTAIRSKTMATAKLKYENDTKIQLTDR